MHRVTPSPTVKKVLLLLFLCVEIQRSVRSKLDVRVGPTLELHQLDSDSLTETECGSNQMLDYLLICRPCGW